MQKLPESNPVSWWCRPDAEFTVAQRAFNAQQKVLGDHALAPAIRQFFIEQEVCQHREASDLPPKRS